jgi:glycosyltransferase involved in cell wall biosynthesis
MIEMFAKAYEKNKTIDLHIYGSGPMKDSLQNRIDALALGEVVFLHPYTENVYEALVKHDVYLMTSAQEGFPNALCEAMAAGLPAIAFRCHEGLRELIRDGDNGFLIDDNNADAFVETMIGLSENHNLCEQIGNEAKKITQIYSEQEVMKRWETCIHTAIRQPM